MWRREVDGDRVEQSDRGLTAEQEVRSNRGLHSRVDKQTVIDGMESTGVFGARCWKGNIRMA